jgi:hypothetical protein
MVHWSFKIQGKWHGFKSSISSVHWLHHYLLKQGFTNFLKGWDPPKISWRQKGDFKQIFYWWPTFIRHHHKNSVPSSSLVCEICAHLFLSSKSERKIGTGQNCFTHLLPLLQQESNTEISKHHSEVSLMHSVTELNPLPSSFQYLLVERMWRVEQEKNSHGKWLSLEGCRRWSLKSKWVSSVVLLWLVFRLCPPWISARPNNCLYWYFLWIFPATSVICPDVTLKISYTYLHFHSLPLMWSYIVACTSSVVKLQTQRRWNVQR